MADPHRTDAHLRIAHAISEQIMTRRFTLKERRALDLILRLSWGCDREWAYIPRLADFETVAIDRGDAADILAALTLQNVIHWNKTSGHLAFNKDFDAWRVSLAIPALAKADRLQELIRTNLSHDCPKPPPDLQAAVALNEQPTPRLPTTQNASAGLPDPPSAPATTSPTLAAAATLYEDNIGHLTPIIAEQLKDLSAQYPELWLVTAITEAARHEKRSLAYVTAILERWHREGFQAPKHKASPGTPPRVTPTPQPSAAQLQQAWNTQPPQERSAP